MTKRWKIQKGETPRECAKRNLGEVVEALIDSYAPNWKVSLGLMKPFTHLLMKIITSKEF